MISQHNLNSLRSPGFAETLSTLFLFFLTPQSCFVFDLIKQTAARHVSTSEILTIGPRWDFEMFKLCIFHNVGWLANVWSLQTTIAAVLHFTKSLVIDFSDFQWKEKKLPPTTTTKLRVCCRPRVFLFFSFFVVFFVGFHAFVRVAYFAFTRTLLIGTLISPLRAVFLSRASRQLCHLCTAIEIREEKSASEPMIDSLELPSNRSSHQRKWKKLAFLLVLSSRAGRLLLAPTKIALLARVKMDGEVGQYTFSLLISTIFCAQHFKSRSLLANGFRREFWFDPPTFRLQMMMSVSRRLDVHESFDRALKLRSALFPYLWWICNHFDNEFLFVFFSLLLQENQWCFSSSLISFFYQPTSEREELKLCAVQLNLHSIYNLFLIT